MDGAHISDDTRFLNVRDKVLQWHVSLGHLKLLDVVIGGLDSDLPRLTTLNPTDQAFELRPAVHLCLLLMLERVHQRPHQLSGENLYIGVVEVLKVAEGIQPAGTHCVDHTTQVVVASQQGGVLTRREGNGFAQQPNQVSVVILHILVGQMRVEIW